jgi:cobalt-zinc-cadmium efflux system outer membrane protein
LVSFLLLAAAPTRATEGLSVTLDDALALLHRQNPELLAAGLRIRAAAGDLTSARRFPNPTLTVGAGNFPVGRTNPSGLGVGQTVNEQVGVSEEVPLWGKRGARVETARGKRAAAEAERADLDRQLAFEVRARFVDLLVANERVRLGNANLDQYRELMRVSRERARNGEISAAELDKIVLEQRAFERELGEAELARRHAAAELLPLLGVDAADLTPVGALELPVAPTDADRLVDEALARRPDLRAAEREADAADAALRQARAERWPNVTVGVQYTHDEFTVAGNLPNSIGGTLGMPLPVLDQNQGAIERAESEALIARHEIDKLRLEIPQEVRTAVREYEVARERVGRFESGFLHQAAEARHAAEVAYREGAMSLLELLEAERTYTETERDHLDALHDGYTAAFDVTRASALEEPAEGRP